ncbi:lon protease homolog 2, peroxisomal-like [Mizuhopecten yessoensis]|uniref:Lon protease homolog 2, peroxisomal n=1 Tax=Mizuhopecten yessoensis TaxID=6573 RepID=A0A210PE85_MIZYE|nr:lon protease homolog 2, peroxisomal-like [Mizuhopecten yessoensis]OWF34794.1 Lon protease-like 2, peroxisomal [Mizuhopecten yessoensis]
MASAITIPRRLPLLLVADNVLLPGSSMRIPVKSMRNMNMVKGRLLSRNTLSSTIIGVIPRDPSDEQGDDLSSIHHIGTAAVVVQVTGTNWPKPAYTLLVTGLCRFKLQELLQEAPYPVATVNQLDKLPGLIDDNINMKNMGELDVLAENFREQASKLVDMLDISIPVVAKLKKMLEKLPDQHLPDICAAIVKASYSEKIQVLDAIDLTERFKKALPLLMRQIEGLKLLQKTRKDKFEIITKKEGSNRPGNMKRMFGKISSDLEEDEDGDIDELMDLEQKIKAADMPEHALKAAMKEFKRMKKMPQQMPEHAMIRNYLDLMVELPWSKHSKDALDIAQARKDMDEDHYGMEKPKKRVLEYLAVRQLKQTLRGPILCFIGPPGVGKTSIGKSIAHTLGREFYRISLGGVCDQSDIRGHRRTYIGSMPGRILQGLKLVGTNNPVFLLDEVDKLGKSLHGDPAAALLEVLDPAQNDSFTDHYLNVPFDLSQVLFIATANNMATIPPALLDRMELIQIPGYTQEEKVNIADRHLIPKQLKEHGLTAEQIQIPTDTVQLIASKYTREAGVRNLERKIGGVCRAVAVRVAEASPKSKGDKPAPEVDKKQIDNESVSESMSQEASTLAHPPEMPFVIDEVALEDILGPPQFESEVSQRLSQPGVAVGMAWTPMGGEILFVEATRMDGEGKLILTGQLGDVMKESANLALNWVRSNAHKLGLSGILSNASKKDTHIHFPAGAVGKDGPSAGVTVVTVLVSLLSKQCVRSDTAMTGEITLRGLVLPVGGIKEKVLAAHRAGLRRIILPKRNEKDLLEIPNNVRNDLAIVLVTRLEDVLNAAFDDGFPSVVSEHSVPSKL